MVTTGIASANGRKRSAAVVGPLALGATVLAVGALLGLWLHGERVATLERETARVSSQARVVAQSMNQQLLGIHRALAGVRDELGRAGKTNGAELAGARFRALAAAMPGVRSMFQIDAEGKVIAASREDLVGLKFQALELFQMPTDQPNRDTMYVSKPFRSPLGPYVICVGRTLTDPTGRYDGAVVASLDPEYLTATLQSGLDQADARGTLIHGGGIVYVNAPALQTAQGMDLSRPGSFFSLHRQSGQESTVHSGKALASGEERLVALRNLSLPEVQFDQPPVVAMTRELSAVYRPWWERAFWVVALYLSLSGAAAIALGLRLRHVRSLEQLREQSAGQLRASAERLELALRAADLGLWDWRSDTGELVANEREQSLLGYAEGEQPRMAHDWEGLVHADDLAALRQAQEQHLRDRTPSYSVEHRMRRTDGSWVRVATHATVVDTDLTGHPTRTVGTHMDVTQRWLADALLRTSMRHASDIQAALDEHAIVAITDPRGRIVSVNDKFCQLSRYSRDELIGKDHRIVNSGHHPPAFFRDLWATIASGRVWRGEIRNRAKDGRFYWVATTIVPCLDDAGRPRQYVAIRADITDLKRLQQEMKQHSDRLEQSNRELEEFAIFASHDLQEPLRKVRSLTELLRQRSGRLLDERSTGYLDMMTGTAERLQHLIRDLLDFSRMSHQLPQFGPVPLRDVARQVLDDLDASVSQSRAQVLVGDLPVVHGDATHLRLLLQNLISNALKFTVDGRAPEVGIQAVRQDDAHWRVEVRDNGVGIAPADREHLFQPFKRLHPDGSKAGSGLGLAICSRIVKRHGGRLWVESGTGAGSCFCFVLAVADPLPHQAASTRHDHVVPQPASETQAP
ncbi:PAS domain S-box [Burkholderiales bacterium JOSHI_001]|nr:PAS domain S-box [Burkholderiales bacterium JOSHI_001]